MDIFDHIMNLSNPKERPGWVNTTGTYTGNVRKGLTGRAGNYGHNNINEYEYRYYAEDEERFGYQRWYPLPDPDPEELKGQTVNVRYNKKKPYMVEVVASDEEDDT